jgi:hypothetical protein
MLSARSVASLSMTLLGAGVVGPTPPPPPPVLGGIGGFLVISHPAFTASIYAFL